MYVVTVLPLLVVLPLISIAANAMLSGHTAGLLFLAGKWFTFWAVGVRLLIAGVRQVLQPAFTAEKIFRIQDPAALPLVREIGFGNLSMGLLGICSLAHQEWLVPSAILGGPYYGFAGAGHIPQKHRNTNESIALVSDAFIFFVLLAFIVGRLA